MENISPSGSPQQKFQYKLASQFQQVSSRFRDLFVGLLATHRVLGGNLHRQACQIMATPWM